MIKQIKPKLPESVQAVVQKGELILQEAKEGKPAVRKAVSVAIIVFIISVTLFLGIIILAAKFAAKTGSPR